MPTRDEVRELAGEDLDHAGASRRLAGSQRPANPSRQNPAARESVKSWMAARVAADEQMRAMAARRTDEPPEPADPNHNRDLIVLLTRDHNQVRFLVQQLSALPGHKKGGSADDIARRRSIVEMITLRLSKHESAEEELLWPTVRSSLADGNEWADGAIRQEQEAKQTLAALAELDPDSDEFDEHIERLVAQLRKHVAYEERVFLLLRGTVTDTDLQKLGGQLLRAEDRAPAGPHHDKAPARN